jgi:2-oxoglutarate ferredoxin oxidoreductase subunit alpha
MTEALAALEAKGLHLDTLRLRAFPFAEDVIEFVNAHDQVFVVEQNRDAQMRSLLVNECAIDPARFISILHYDGTPIMARFITTAIAERMDVKPKTKEAAE